MLWFVIVGFLAAFGALCAVYILLTLRRKPLPGVILLCKHISICQEFAVIRRHSRLYALGLFKSPLVLVDSSFTPKEQLLLCKKHPYLTFYTQAELHACFLGENDHAGTGDLTGYHHSGDIPEL